jgi:hypothetical protein
MGARLTQETDHMGAGSVMDYWATYQGVLTTAQIARLAAAWVGPVSIGLNFGADEYPDSPGAGSLAATDVAGAPGVAQANWNNLELLSGSSSEIVMNVGGAAEPTSVLVEWNSANTWSSTGRGEENNGLTGTDQALLTGYLDTGSATTSTVIISGLPEIMTSGGYDVYVYALGGVGGRGGGYRIVDADSGEVLKDYVRAQSATNPTEWVQAPTGDPAVHGAGNYLVFSGLAAANITIEATTEAGHGFSGTPRAPINAVQLVAPASGAAEGPEISLARTADGLSITFTGVLQAADSVTGPWTDVAGATSPRTVNPTAAQRFYRSVNP